MTAPYNHPVLLCAGLATTVSLVAAAWDVKTRRIPNLLTLSTFCAALILRMSLDGWKSSLSGLAAGTIAGLVFFLFHVAGGMGAGDVKLITALGAFYGLSGLPYLLVFTAIAGGVMAVLLSIQHGRLRETIGNIGTLAIHHRHAGLTPHETLNVSNGSTLRLPYAVAICAGCILTNFIVLG